MAKPKPKPKPIKLPTSAILGYGSQAAPPPVKAGAKAGPSLADIAKAFGGAGNAVAFSDAQTHPPEGSYDPQLDAQGETQNWNAVFGTQDYLTGNQNRLDDYTDATGQRDLGHQYSLSDLFKAGGRALEDYNTRTQDLGTQYGRLGTSQTQSANAAGVGGGGALVAAQLARAGNQAHDQSAIDTGWTRQQQDIQQGVDRENQAYVHDRGDPMAGTLGVGGTMKQGYDRATAAADIGQQRLYGTTNLFNRQLGRQKTYQAVNSGNPLPDTAATAPPPYSEFTKYSGTHKGIVYHRYPDGTVKPVRKVGY